MMESLDRFFRKKPQIFRHHDARELTGAHIAILATDGVEQSELFEPRSALLNAGAITHLISLHPGKIKTWINNTWSKAVDVDMTVREAWSMEFDALVIPGGVINSDLLRANAEAVAFVMSFINKHRPVAAICHGVQMLIEAGALKHKRVTSWPSIKTDIQNAGAHWEDKEVIIDHKIITSRRPSDLPMFNAAMIREFTYGRISHDKPGIEGFDLTF